METRRLIVGAVMLTCLGASQAHADINPGVVPIGPGPQGGLYGVLSAKWWQWATEAPTPVNPLVDTTGAHCGTNQKDHVWFLAGTLGGGTVVRSCTIPGGQTLFFPLANTFAGAFLSDPPAMRTPQFLRPQTDCIVGAAVTATIDGKAVIHPQQYLEQSVVFSIQLPKDNIFGLTAADAPKLLIEPTVDQGYYLWLTPLAPGKHTIHFTSAAGSSSCAPTQDITYHLTVTR